MPAVFTSILLFPSLISLWGMMAFQSQPGPSFLIDPASRLEIHGSSNVNEFICTCRQTFVRLPFQIIGGHQPGRNIWLFQNTQLRLQTQLFDCGNKVMNKDFYNALKSKTHPTMWIELETIDEVRPISTSWTTFITQTRIIIAGARRSVPIQARVRRLSNNQIQILAEKALKMSDFGITPPTALMGMIKTNDEITIKLDLKVTIQE